MKIKVLVAEDERLAREELVYGLKQEEDLILCPSAENGRQLMELYKQYEPHVVFLDVEMPVLSGMEAAKQLLDESTRLGKPQPLFVFITAYDEYAVEAFGIEAVDYLLKPYGSARLKEAINRIRKRMAHPPVRTSTKLLVEDGEKVIVLKPDEICFASRMDRMIEIHTKTECVQTKMTLQELEEKLNGYPFFKPHRSYLVNLDYIHEIVPWFNGAYNLILKERSDVKIPVSRKAAKTLFRRLQRG